MRKLSIVLLVGLMLIGGAFSVAYAEDGATSETAKTGTDAGSVSDFSLDVNAGFSVKYIAAIYVGDNDVDLGTLDSDDYTMDADGGSWDIDQLSSSNHEVAAFANTDYDLQVSASDQGTDNESVNELSDTSSFKMKGGESAGSWHEVIGNNTSFNLVTDSSPGANSWSNIAYKYEPDPDDGPGDYQVSVTYTISTD